MKLLIINPNTSASTNRRIEAVARPFMSISDTLEVVSANSGVKFIETIEQSNQTKSAVLEKIRKKSSSVDGIIIAAFSEPGLLEAKIFSVCPVVGIAEASMKIAQGLTERFAIITLGPQFSHTIQQNAVRYGTAKNLVEIKILPWSVMEVSNNLSSCSSIVSGLLRSSKDLIRSNKVLEMRVINAPGIP